MSRRFILRRAEDESGVSGIGDVAWGVEFPDGVVVMRWNTVIRSTAVYDSISSVESIHGHFGKTVIVWVDGQQPLGRESEGLCEDRCLGGLGETLEG